MVPANAAITLHPRCPRSGGVVVSLLALRGDAGLPADQVSRKYEKLEKKHTAMWCSLTLLVKGQSKYERIILAKSFYIEIKIVLDMEKLAIFILKLMGKPGLHVYISVCTYSSSKPGI